MTHVVLLETNVFGTSLYYTGVVDLPADEWKRDQALLYRIFGSDRAWLNHAAARERAERYAYDHNMELVEEKLPGPLPTLQEALRFLLGRIWDRHHLAEGSAGHRDEDPLTRGELRRFATDLSALLELVIEGMGNPK
jgi:hypothetical protein